MPRAAKRVPEGPLIVARQLTGGISDGEDARAVGTPEKSDDAFQPSLRDGIILSADPALKRRATIRRPYGARFVA